MSRRAETGPMRFGDDWAGVFVRGDTAAAIAMALRRLKDLDDKDKLPPEALIAIGNISRAFDGRHIEGGKRAEAQQLKSFEQCVAASPSEASLPILRWEPVHERGVVRGAFVVDDEQHPLTAWQLRARDGGYCILWCDYGKWHTDGAMSCADAQRAAETALRAQGVVFRVWGEL